MSCTRDRHSLLSGSPQQHYRLQNTALSGRSCQKSDALCEGASVRVFSQSADKWVSGEVSELLKDNFVRVEYGANESWCGKVLHLHSEHLAMPSKDQLSRSPSQISTSSHDHCEHDPERYLINSSDPTQDEAGDSLACPLEGEETQKFADNEFEPRHSTLSDSSDTSFKTMLSNFIVDREFDTSSASLFGLESRRASCDYGLLGTCMVNEKMPSSHTGSVYLNVEEPFCFLAVGVQGSGKSHTTAVVLENCLMQCLIPRLTPTVKLRKPMAALVMHYDQLKTSECEATGLVRLSDTVREYFTGRLSKNAPVAPKVVVLISPSYFKQREKAYDSSQYDVYPLLFRWKSLDAVQLKKLMQFHEGDSQLYVGMMLDVLRRCQREAKQLEFDAFCSQVLDKCFNIQQRGPLEQRLRILKQFVAESQDNANLENRQKDLLKMIGSGILVVADLTDPMLSPPEANGVFQVLLEQFRQAPLTCGKVVVFDEAHRYFDARCKGGDGLANTIVDAVRLMRHEGIRVIVSTQSPLTMPPELLELSTVVACHRFHSQDWFQRLVAKLPLSPRCFEVVRKLCPGQALVFSTRMHLTQLCCHSDPRATNADFLGDDVAIINMRARLTKDCGVSKKS